MNRKSMYGIGMCVVGLALLATWTPATAAASSTGTLQATTSPTAGHGQIFERLKAALAQLDLTPAQKTQIHGILKNARGQLEALRAQATSGNRQGLREQVKAIVRQTRQKIAAVLTPAQKAQLRELLKEHKQGT